jgi:hypothetical protein
MTECLLLAQNGHSNVLHPCPLSGVKGTSADLSDDLSETLVTFGLRPFVTDLSYGRVLGFRRLQRSH